jgi:granule-bound starch synthase
MLSVKLIMCINVMQGPAKLWEKMLLSLDVSGSEPGIEEEEIAPLAKENVATP